MAILCVASQLSRSANVPPIAAVYVQRAAGLTYRYFYELRQLPVDFVQKLSAMQGLRRSARIQKLHTLLLPSEVNLLPASSNREISTSSPPYKLIHLWNLLSSNDVSCGLSRFCMLLSDYHCEDSRLSSILVSLCNVFPARAAFSTL